MWSDSDVLVQLITRQQTPVMSFAKEACMVQDALHREMGKEDGFQEHWKEESLSKRL